ALREFEERPALLLLQAGGVDDDGESARETPFRGLHEPPVHGPAGRARVKSAADARARVLLGPQSEKALALDVGAYDHRADEGCEPPGMPGLAAAGQAVRQEEHRPRRVRKAIRERDVRVDLFPAPLPLRGARIGL